MSSMLHLSTYQGVAAREAALLHGQFTPRGKALLMLQSTFNDSGSGDCLVAGIDFGIFPF